MGTNILCVPNSEVCGIFLVGVVCVIWLLSTINVAAFSELYAGKEG